MRTNAWLAALTLLVAVPAFAQDYPYDNPDSAPAAELPTEAPAARNPKDKLPPLFRIGVKAGSDFSVLRDPATDGVTSYSYSGFSGGFLFGFGWDLPYQPIFLELETGYKALFLTEKSLDVLNLIPIRFGIFRRMRVGHDSLFKFGLVPAFDLRIAKDELGDNGFSLVPSVTLAAAWEVGSWVLQPEFTLFRLQSRQSFFSFGLYTGVRF